MNSEWEIILNSLVFPANKPKAKVNEALRRHVGRVAEMVNNCADRNHGHGGTLRNAQVIAAR